jgi:hypothetical protein
MRHDVLTECVRHCAMVHRHTVDRFDSHAATSVAPLAQSAHMPCPCPPLNRHPLFFFCSKVAPFTGATIRLERGSVWVDDLLSVPGLVGGALADFGNGSLPRPAIWHSRSAVIDPHGERAAASVCVRLGDPRDVVVSNLHLAGCYVGVSLEFDPTAATPASNVTLTNCSFADIRTPYGAVQPSLGKSTSLITFTCGG